MSSVRGAGQLICPDVSTQSCQRHGDQTPHMIKLGEINILWDVLNSPNALGALRLVRGPQRKKEGPRRP